MRKPTIKGLKKKCWALFSLYIRLKETDNKGYGNCVTCGKLKHIKELQAGHFVDGRGNSILFDQRGVHIQCYSCNVMLHGNKLRYWKWMEEKYGRQTIDELMALSKQSKKFTIPELQKLAVRLSLQCIKLEKSKNGIS